MTRSTPLLLAVLAALLLVLPPTFAAEEETAVFAEPTLLLEVPWGKDRGQVRRRGEVGEGAPSSFLQDRSGWIHLLDAPGHRILAFSADGKLEREFPLRGASGLTTPTYWLDFALTGGGDYLVLDETRGTVARFSADGKPGDVFGRIVSARNLDVAPDGRVLVRDDGIQAVDVFSPEGQFQLAVEDSQAGTTWIEGDGVLRSLMVNDDRALVSLLSFSGEQRTLLTVGPSQEGLALYDATVCGRDDKGRFYVVLTEGKDGKPTSSFLLRCSASGQVQQRLRIRSTYERFLTIPRFYRATPGGRVLTFRTTADYYQILAYSFDEGD